ncbi:MAG: hypothetical protein ACR2FU_25365 [Streptosporangiaceae bacterium]
MTTLGLFALAVLLPTIAGYAAVLGVRAWRRAAEARRRPPPPEPLHALTGRLRRLRAGLEAVENTPRGPARQHKLRATRGAYLDVLRAACERLGVPPPPGGDRARQADIYRAEAGLRQRGIEVRATARR